MRLLILLACNSTDLKMSKSEKKALFLHKWSQMMSTFLENIEWVPIILYFCIIKDNIQSAFVYIVKCSTGSSWFHEIRHTPRDGDSPATTILVNLNSSTDSPAFL